MLHCPFTGILHFHDPRVEIKLWPFSCDFVALGGPAGARAPGRGLGHQLLHYPEFEPHGQSAMSYRLFRGGNPRLLGYGQQLKGEVRESVLGLV